MLFAIIGGVVAGLLAGGSVLLHCHASLTVPPKDLTRRWRSETSAGSRGRYAR